jgi:hypothetical protein
MKSFLLAGLASLFSVHAFAESSHCTVISSVPTTLSKAGLYCLTEDLAHSASGPAITIDADNVTVDLNGHTLRAIRSPGVAEVSYQGFAVSGHKYFSIIDGVINGFTIAVFVSDTTKTKAAGGLVADLRVLKSINPLGIDCDGCVVRNNTIIDSKPISGQTNTTVIGIAVDGTGNQVTGNRVYGTVNGSTSYFAAAGIEVDGDNSVVSNNYVSNETIDPNTVVYGTGTNMLLSDNQVQNVEYCYWLESSSLKYRNNLSNGCVESFGGFAAGQGDLGGNN